MFTYTENFCLWDENGKPYGINIESSSNLWHKHAKCTKDGYIVYCTGNKYLLDLPPTQDFEAELSYLFEVVGKHAGVSFFWGYDPEKHNGYELRIGWNSAEKRRVVEVLEIKEERFSTLASKVLENRMVFIRCIR